MIPKQFYEILIFQKSVSDTHELVFQIDGNKIVNLTLNLNLQTNIFEIHAIATKENRDFYKLCSKNVITY